MPHRIRRGAAAVLAVSGLLLTAACGSGDDQGDKAGKNGELSAATMKAALLTAEDLPSGYQAGQPGPSGGPATTADKPECEPIAVFLNDTIKGAAKGGSVDFEGPGGGTQLSQQVFTFPGGEAAGFVRGIGAALERCTDFGASVAGEKMTIGVRKIDGPEVGEESHSLNLTTEIKQLQMTFDIQVLVASEGTGMTRLTHVPGQEADKKKFADLADRKSVV